MENDSSQGLTPEQNEEAIRLGSEHKKAMQEQSYAVFDKTRDLYRNPEPPTGAEADGVVVSSNEPNNTSDTNSDKYIDDVDKAQTVAIAEDPYRTRAAESRANAKTSDNPEPWLGMSTAFDEKADKVGDSAAKRYDRAEGKEEQKKESAEMSPELIEELKARRQEFGPADKNVEGASKELFEELEALGIDPNNPDTWKTIYLTTKTILAREHDLSSKGLPHPWSEKVISMALLNLMPEELKSQLDS